MNLGSCPYEGCAGSFMTALPDRPLPVFVKDECEECHRPVWLKLSRADPVAWTEAGFLAEFDIDETTKQIVPKKATA